MSARAARRAGAILRWVWALPIAAFVALALAWGMERGRAWERPRWDERLVVPIVMGPAAPGAEVRVVAVHPGCPHCTTGLKQLARRRREAGAARDRLIALVVDTPLRPSPALAETLGVADLRWDRAGVWRHRWGHRVYGEVMRFDPSGAYRGSGHVADADPLANGAPDPNEPRGGENE
jgi:hypothetical protein